MAPAVAALTSIKLVLNSGFRFVYPFLPAIGRGLGVDLTQMGALLSVRWGASFTVPIAVRALHRRQESRRLLWAGLLSFGLGSLVTALWGVFVAAIVGFALIGLGKPLFDIGSQTYVSERVPYARRARALGILELSWAGGFLIGAPLAGWLIDGWGWETPFWVFGSLAVVALGVVALVLEPVDSPQAGERRAGSRTASGVAPFLVAVVIAGFTFELVFVVLGAWLEGAFAMSLFALSGVGILLGVAELGGEGVMVGFTDRLGKRNTFAGGLGATAGALGVLAVFSDDLVPGLVALFFVILFLELAAISGIPLASEFRPARRSRFLSWFLVTAGVGRIIADLVGPALFEAGGMPAVALTAAGAATVGMVVLLTLVEEL